ncbi:MAG: sensor histidine kinase [Clostridium sp.]|uniref:sensor histidine kinase n=1 Tax=Clostridium sp. TaxID=1506 RepID=UPI003F359340
MKFFKLLIIIFLGSLFFPSASYANTKKTVLVLDSQHESEFSLRLFEGIKTQLAEHNVNTITYNINNSDDVKEIKHIEHIARENKVLSIISLDKASYNLIKKFSSKYLLDQKIYLLGFEKDSFKFPSNIKTFFLNFDFEKKFDYIVDVHNPKTINIVMDKEFAHSNFYPYIQDYIKKNPSINYNIVLADEYEKTIEKFITKDAIIVVFSPLYENADESGFKRKITPFGSVEKLARFTDLPIYGGFREFGTRFNIGAFNYSGIFVGHKIADTVLLDNNLIPALTYAPLNKYNKTDFYINEDLNKYHLKETDDISISTYTFKENITLSGEKKVNRSKFAVMMLFILLTAFLFKYLLFRRSFKERIKVDKLKTNFIANISHELRTPLNIIISTISLFEIYMKNGEVIFKTDNSLEKFNYLKKNSFRLLKLINNIIDTTRIDAGYFSLDKQTYNIVEIVEDISLSTVAYAEKKDISITFDTDFEEIYTLVDRDKMERVSLNLISNSLKFTPAGGTISIFISLFDKSTICIQFSDTGLGISEDDQKTIFDRFVQSSTHSLNKSEGSGIGLSLCKSIIEQHGGSIEVQSSLNIGSTFTIYLPLVETNEALSPYLNNSRINELTEIEFSDH